MGEYLRLYTQKKIDQLVIFLSSLRLCGRVHGCDMIAEIYTSRVSLVMG